MNTDVKKGQSIKVPMYQSIMYRLFGVIFCIIAVLTLYASLYDFGKLLQQQAMLFMAYAVLGFLFSFGLWGYRKWVVSLFAINALGVTFLKLFWLYQGAGDWTNITTSIGVATLFALGTYATRKTLRGTFIEPAFLMTLVLCWIVIIENSAIR